jgi:hypothetical protein
VGLVIPRLAPLLERVGPVVGVLVEGEPVGPDHPGHAHAFQHGGLLLLLLLLRLAEGLPKAGRAVAAHGSRKLLAAPPLGEIVRVDVKGGGESAHAAWAAEFRGPQPDVMRREREAGMQGAVGEAIQAAGGGGRLGTVAQQVQALL